MKIYLSPSDQAGLGKGNYGTEGQRMQELSNKVKTKLQAKGHTVYGSNNSKGLTERIAESNSLNVNVHVALHSNAGGGTGPEVWYYTTSSNGKRLAQCILDKIVTVPGCPKSRGIKADSTEYGELRQTVAPAVIVEVAFHDNANDAAWILNNMDAIAQAIADGIAAY